MFEYDIRNPLVHVPLSLTDTCQLFLSITERGQKDHIEYKAASQNFTANVRYVESRQNHRSIKWLLIAHSGPSNRDPKRIVALQQQCLRTTQNRSSVG